jgi:alcohol dehydrogenase class IV
MAHVYSSPRYVFYGNGALEDAAQTLAGFGRKALIVSGMSMIRQGHMKALTDLLESLGTAYEIFSGISGEPTDTMILEGARIYREKGCDFLIGFGGGSPLDSAKAIAVMADYEGRISDFNGKVIERDLPPVAAIPSRRVRVLR